MRNVSGVVQQLKKELERAENEASRFRAALAALGKVSFKRTSAHDVGCCS